METVSTGFWGTFGQIPQKNTKKRSRSARNLTTSTGGTFLTFFSLFWRPKREKSDFLIVPPYIDRWKIDACCWGPRDEFWCKFWPPKKWRFFDKLSKPGPKNDQTPECSKFDLPGIKKTQNFIAKKNTEISQNFTNLSKFHQISGIPKKHQNLTSKIWRSDLGILTSGDRISGIPKTQVSNFRNSKSPGVKFPEFQKSGCQISGIPQIRMSNFRNSKSPGVKFPEFQKSGCQISGIPKTQVSNFRNSKNPGVKFPEFQNPDVKFPGISQSWPTDLGILTSGCRNPVRTTTIRGSYGSRVDGARPTTRANSDPANTGSEIRARQPPKISRISRRPFKFLSWRCQKNWITIYIAIYICSM
jgi:hypothetical protein